MMIVWIPKPSKEGDLTMGPDNANLHDSSSETQQERPEPVSMEKKKPKAGIGSAVEITVEAVVEVAVAVIDAIVDG